MSMNSFTITEFANRTGIEWSKSFAIMILHERDSKCTMKFLIYHACKLNIAVDSLPFDHGFPYLPYKCPNCEHTINNHNDLGYDFLVTMIDNNAIDDTLIKKIKDL